MTHATERPEPITLEAARRDCLFEFHDYAHQLSSTNIWTVAHMGQVGYLARERLDDYELQGPPKFVPAYDEYHWMARFGSFEKGWHRDLQRQYGLHPVVESILRQYAPLDLQQVCFEWPHVSVEDPTMLAFTPDQNKGRANVQIRTKIGKYLAKHWPHVPEHERRDFAAQHSVDEFVILTTLKEIIEAVEIGPQSCMTSMSSYCCHPFSEEEYQNFLNWRADKSLPEPNWTAHPYCFYDPALGWGLAVRRNKKGEIKARALVYGLTEATKDKKWYVRTYVKRSDSSSQSSDDQMLAQWVKSQGFTHKHTWPDGVQFAKAKYNKRHLMPYIDGSTRFSGSTSDSYPWEANSCGSYEGDATTTGYLPDVDEEESIGSCDDCGNTVYESDEDRLYAGPDEDSLIGGCCAHHYEYVRGDNRWGSGYREYYVHDENVCYVNGQTYDTENLPDTVVECQDGEYRLREECVEIDGDYHHIDDCVLLAEPDNCGNEFALIDDAWEDDDGEWHHNSVPRPAPDTTPELMEGVFAS